MEEKFTSRFVLTMNRTQTVTLLGPHRVLPGRLSVSRTFGDIEAKNPKYGGNPKVVIATADIKAFKIQKDYDFIVLGCIFL
jgi:protein phosphatase 2C family protein 2/3